MDVKIEQSWKEALAGEFEKPYFASLVSFLRNEKAADAGGKDMVSPLVDMLLNMRMEAKANKDWATSDKIRDNLTAIGIRVKDRKDGFDWEIE